MNLTIIDYLVPTLLIGLEAPGQELGLRVQLDQGSRLHPLHGLHHDLGHNTQFFTTIPVSAEGPINKT